MKQERMSRFLVQHGCWFQGPGQYSEPDYKLKKLKLKLKNDYELAQNF
jgi:hypothetical protein